MKLSSAFAFLGLVAGAISAGIAPRDWDNNDYYVLHLDPNTSPDDVAKALGLRHEGPLGELRDHHVFVAKKDDQDIVKRQLKERKKRRALGERHVLDGVLFSQKQRLRSPWQKRIPPVRQGPAPLRPRDSPDETAVQLQKDIANVLGIHDPIFNEQWHLFNTVQVGHDVNVTGLWLQGVTGKNATVAIVDDGLDMYSNDLKDNYYAAGSYDFNDKTEEPKPRLSDDKHGTRCAGEVAAVRNDVCGVGVAYDSKVAGLRILSKLISDADEAVALNYDFQHNQIYSCSWGPPDDGRSMDAPGILIRRAMLNAIQNGRGGLGSIYVFASGNGAQNDDNCNFDGYTNSIYSITVGAIDRRGLHPHYSEKCSAGLVVTYSSGSDDYIHTTDVGPNMCARTHGGTSAAAPLAAGIFALVLQVRPDLSWRDMQYLAMDTAVPVNLDEPDWQTTAIGKKFSHTYGYGKLDSYAIVEAAKTWKKVKPQAWFFSPWIHVKKPIPQGDQGIAVTFEVTEQMLKEANLERVEHITVTMNVEHGRRGDLSVDLISPHNVVSHLSVTRKFDDATTGYDDWTFMSVAHWGESGVGTWTIIVRDTIVNSFTGTFIDWHLKLWGECRDPAKAKLLPMPTEDEDDDHDAIPTTTVGSLFTTSAPANAHPTSSIPESALNHQPTRPVKGGKPTSTSTAGSEQPTEAAANQNNWLPSFLPKFGVSASTQAWIYGSLVLIILFCSGLGIYLWLARRKRLRNNPRNDYEFELLNDQDDVDGPGGDAEKGVGGAGTGKRRTRGGELYDAFAGESDEESDEVEAGGVYRDHPEGSGGSGSPIRVGEKLPAPARARRDSDEESGQHVIGDSDDEEESDDEQARPLQRGSR